MNPGQEVALANFCESALALAAPALALEVEIVRGRGHAIPELNSAQLRLPATQAESPEPGRLYLHNNDDDTKMVERVIDRGELRAELEVRVVEPRDAIDTAFQICCRARRAMVRDALQDQLEAGAVGIMALEDVTDISALVRDVQWEGRAQFVIVASYTVIEDALVDRVASFDISGKITSGDPSPSGDPAELPIDADTQLP